ncbi:MAG: hypothetical protein R3A46_10925 [Thermomicrobiales bacterium]
MFALLGFLTITYLIILGIVMMVLASIQEASKSRPNLDTRWDMTSWSVVKFVSVGALLTLPSLIILIPIGLLFIV